MSIEFDINTTGQFNFFSIVTEKGRLIPWEGSSETSGEKTKWYIPKRKERLTVEDFFTEYNIPKRIVPDNCFVALDAPDIYPSGENVQFIDKDSGYILAEIFFEELEPSFYLKVEEGTGEKVYKPRKLGEYSYERSVMHHPILNEDIQGVLVTLKTWDIDSKFRRRKRDELHQVFVDINDDWDPESGHSRCWNKILVESSFKGPGDVASVNKPVEYIEESRSFLFPRKMFIYKAEGVPPELLLSSAGIYLRLDEENKFNKQPKESYQIGTRLIFRKDIPAGIGEPRRIMF